MYLQSPQRYMMELFHKRANDFTPQAVLGKKTNFVINVSHGSKYTSDTN